jgi:hypothetical protein
MKQERLRMQGKAKERRGASQEQQHKTSDRFPSGSNPRGQIHNGGSESVRSTRSTNSNNTDIDRNNRYVKRFIKYSKLLRNDVTNQNYQYKRDKYQQLLDNFDNLSFGGSSQEEEFIRERHERLDNLSDHEEETRSELQSQLQSLKSVSDEKLNKICNRDDYDGDDYNEFKKACELETKERVGGAVSVNQSFCITNIEDTDKKVDILITNDGLLDLKTKNGYIYEEDVKICSTQGVNKDNQLNGKLYKFTGSKGNGCCEWNSQLKICQAGVDKCGETLKEHGLPCTYYTFDCEITDDNKCVCNVVETTTDEPTSSGEGSLPKSYEQTQELAELMDNLALNKR